MEEGTTRKKRQDVYVAARLDGVEGKEAARLAGYAESSQPAMIERRGGAVHNKMIAALSRLNINEDTLAQEYVDGVKKSKRDRNGDYQAHAKYLLQLGYLLGYGKQGPSVAVQINNSGAAQPDDIDGVKRLIPEIESLLQMVKTELGRRKPDGVLEGSVETGSAEACEGVVRPPQSPQQITGGGQP